MVDDNPGLSSCRHCGVVIVRKSNKGPVPRTCPPCRKALDRQTVIRKLAEKRNAARFYCVDCAQEVFTTTERLTPPKRCPDCKREVWRRYGRRVSKIESANAREKFEREGRPPVVCPDCGTTFKPLHRHGRPIRCRPCQKVREDRRRKERIAANRERRREIARKGSQVRRARKMGAEVEHFTHREIFDRDRWMCGICRKRISRKRQCPDPRSVSLDHIIPISEGGPHTRANSRAAHLGCNVRRHNRGGGEQLALVG